MQVKTSLTFWLEKTFFMQCTNLLKCDSKCYYWDKPHLYWLFFSFVEMIKDYQIKGVCISDNVPHDIKRNFDILL